MKKRENCDGISEKEYRENREGYKKQEKLLFICKHGVNYEIVNLLYLSTQVNLHVVAA